MVVLYATGTGRRLRETARGCFCPLPLGLAKRLIGAALAAAPLI